MSVCLSVFRSDVLAPSPQSEVMWCRVTVIGEVCSDVVLVCKQHVLLLTSLLRTWYSRKHGCGDIMGHQLLYICAMGLDCFQLRAYSGTCLRWSLYKADTNLKQPASLAPNTNIALTYCSTRTLQPTSVEQLPLCKGQL